MKVRVGTVVLCTILLIALVSFGIKNITTPYPFPVLNRFPEMPVNPKNPVTIEGADLGRYLFYDPILSKDSSFSCASCHQQQYAFSDAPNRFSKGIDGTLQTRNTPPLFNLAWYPSMFWDGKAKSIEEQVFFPVREHDEMNLDWKEAEKRIAGNKFYKEKFKTAFGNAKIDSNLIAMAIAQFERTLISNQSKYDKVFKGDVLFTKEEYKGFVLMNDMSMADCLHCHVTDADGLGTNRKFSNNGIDSIADPLKYTDRGLGDITGKIEDNGKFKVPSLRNIAITAPYMHDGRFNTLEEVLDFYSEGVNKSANIDSKMEFAHQRGVILDCDEKKQIIAFLNTLTDSVFITNPAFSNPFKNK